MADSPTTDINPQYTKEGFGATSNQTHIVSTTNSVQDMLDQTLGEVLQSNPQAQQMVIRSMGITPEKFEEMRGMAQGSNMMQMTLRELIEKGVVQPSSQTDNSAESAQQMTTNTATPQDLLVQQGKTLLNKAKGWFK
ncbi:MAG: hypothetical protein ACREHC_04260 [Candidatus Levyibacteriota bacterium]